MERFVYKAKTKEGKDQQGQVEARDIHTAVAVLRERGMVVVSIKPLHDSSGLGMITSLTQKVGMDDIVAFTRQFSTMIASGLSLTESLNVLEVQSKPALSKVIGEVLREVQAGSSLAEAMEKQEDAFSGVYVSLIRAGEASGSLDQILLRLADDMEKQKEFQGKIKGALIYPVIVVLGMVAVSFIMMVFVVPKMAVMYEDFDAELPLATQILISTSNFMSRFWFLIILGAGGGVWGLIKWRSTPKGRKKFDQLMLRLPVFGKLSTQVVLAQMSRTLSLLITSGISLLESLEIASGVLTNRVFRDSLGGNIKSVKKGIPLSVSMYRQGIFPPLLPNMVAVGEETGKMDEVLLKVAHYYEVESEHTVKNLTTALEPLIMVVLGLGVGFLVIAIIMPIYNLTNQF